MPLALMASLACTNVIAANVEAYIGAVSSAIALAPCILRSLDSNRGEPETCEHNRNATAA